MGSLSIALPSMTAAVQAPKLEDYLVNLLLCKTILIGTDSFWPTSNYLFSVDCNDQMDIAGL
jgi:hypothetical protein